MNAQMRLVIMLASVAVSGSLLFAAEGSQQQKSAEQPAAATQATPTPAPKSSEDAAKPGTGAAQSPKEDPPKPTAAPTPKPAETPAEEAVPSEDQDPAPKRPATAADRSGSPQRFTPSEQVRADFDVSFPIDI